MKLRENSSACAPCRRRSAQVAGELLGGVANGAIGAARNEPREIADMARSAGDRHVVVVQMTISRESSAPAL